MVDLAAIFAGFQGLMILLFVLGVILIVIEIIMPGFGVAGVLGIISLLGGIVVAARVVTPLQLTFIIAIVLIIIVVLLNWVYRSATKGGRISRMLLLNSKTGSEEGYNSTKNMEDMLGAEGVATTTLRPTGTCEFDGRKIDVVTNGDFIMKGNRVKVVKVEGFRIVVEEISE